MDHDFWVAMVGAIVGIFGYEMTGIFLEHLRHPYRWSCPDCHNFKISTNHKEALVAVKRDHQQDHWERA